MRTIRRARAATGAAGLLLLAGCGHGGQAGTGPASTVPASTVPASTVPASTVPASTVPASTVPGATAGACALVTQQEASAAFGHRSSSPQPAASGPAGGKACAYFADANQDSLQVALLRNVSQSELAAIKSSVQIPGGATSAVSGIGDSATVISAGPTAMVIFTKGSSLVILTLNLIGHPAPVHAATVLAGEAAARI